METLKSVQAPKNRGGNLIQIRSNNLAKKYETKNVFVKMRVHVATRPKSTSTFFVQTSARQAAFSSLILIALAPFI